jgi:hypothetical protein
VGCRSLTVCHLGIIAKKLGRGLKWDSAAERFINDAEADRMLSRAVRSPWKSKIIADFRLPIATKQGHKEIEHGMQNIEHRIQNEKTKESSLLR